MEHENEHLDIREKLLRLPKLQADENFLKRLQIQIDILDSEERTRDVVDKGTASSYFKNLFGARLVPALGISSLVVAAFLVYFILGDKKDAVVNNMTSSKNTETIITKEQPGETNSPVVTGKELTQKELTDIKEKVLAKTEEKPRETPDTYGNKIAQPKVTDERSLQQSVQDIKKNVNIDQEQSGRTMEEKPAPVVIPEKKTDKIKDAESSSIEPKKETMKTEAPVTSTEKEKTVNEGGRGNTDTKTAKANIKPKKKDLNGVIEINKSGLESIRDKVK
ncbi:MAG: hypothetical protein JST55_11835 [Bacteroidetes bacterium]|nr:hypothetical protein [Bacteroidota bacterium]